MVSVPLGVFTASGFTNTKNTVGLTDSSLASGVVNVVVAVAFSRSALLTVIVVPLGIALPLQSASNMGNLRVSAPAANVIGPRPTFLRLYGVEQAITNETFSLTLTLLVVQSPAALASPEHNAPSYFPFGKGSNCPFVLKSTISSISSLTELKFLST